MLNLTRYAAFAVCTLAVTATAASAQNCPNGMRKINIGVSVAPPNVVHTSPYVAKALGYFEKRCIDANIVQFEGGQSPAASLRRPGHRDRQRQRRLDRPRPEGAADLGLAPRMPQAYMVPGEIKTARPQGQAAVGDRRRRRRLQLAHGPRGAAQAAASTSATPSSSPPPTAGRLPA